jgi:hypothetical protein
MRLSCKIILVTCLIVLLHQISFAQHSNPDTVWATPVTEKISLDGKLDERAWQNILSVENFTQRELNFGQAASEKTKIAVAYDRLALYIGVWCYQKDAKSIRTKFMQRDFDYTQDDNFQIALSPFNDKRNGYLFIINPNGARTDLQVSGDNDNIDWNGVWDAKTSRNDSGWFAEVQIPFNTLQFKNGDTKFWSINFERNIRDKKEQDRWQGWSRDYSFENFQYAGTLTGISNISYSKHFELRPYALGGFEKNKNEKINFPGKTGADLNVNLSPTLKLNLTANTDFAQVEADRIQTNLTRFNLYYPEKRDFFLEGYNNFQIYLGNNNQLFYTRKIGLEQLQPVSVLGGARVFGKVGKSNIGFLSLETGKRDTIPATNNTVFRYKYDIGRQSYIGGIITSHVNGNNANQVYGVDANYTTSSFLKNKNLVIAGLIAESVNDYKTKDNSLGYRIFCDYPNDLVDHFIAISGLQQNFNPSLGFLQRQNYKAFNWHLVFDPRWFTRYGIRQFDFKFWDLAYFVTQSTKELESWNNEIRPLGFTLKSGERFEFNLQQSYDRLEKEFAITDSAIIPVGRYKMHNTEFQFSTYQARRIWLELFYNYGKFYTGKIKTFSSSIGLNLSKHFNLNTNYTYNRVSLPNANVATNELAQYINYAFTTKLDMSLFVQWNSLDDILFGNFRLHWIPNIGSDLYVVYNWGYNKLDNLKLGEPDISSGVAKLVWRFTF